MRSINVLTIQSHGGANRAEIEAVDPATADPAHRQLAQLRLEQLTIARFTT